MFIAGVLYCVEVFDRFLFLAGFKYWWQLCKEVLVPVAKCRRFRSLYFILLSTTDILLRLVSQRDRSANCCFIKAWMLVVYPQRFPLVIPSRGIFITPLATPEGTSERDPYPGMGEVLITTTDYPGSGGGGRDSWNGIP